MDIAVGRPKGAAMIRPVRHRFASKAWAFGRRGVRRSMGIAVGRPSGRNDKAGAPSVCKPGAGASGAAAAVGKRRRERDAELQIQAPRLTVRR